MSTETVVTASACRIERVVHRKKFHVDGPIYAATADFIVHSPLLYGKPWTPVSACSISDYEPATVPISVDRYDELTLEQAAAVGTAISMAVDWVATELANEAQPTPHQPGGGE